MKSRQLFIIAVLSILVILGVVGCNNTNISKETETSSDSAAIESTDETRIESESDTVKVTQPDETDSKETEPITEVEVTARHELSTNELESFTALLQEVENNGFLLSSYVTPEDIDLHQLLYNGAGMIMDNTLSSEERNAYEAVSGEIYTDITHLTTTQIDEFLHKKMGIGFADTTLELDWTYLSEFDAYYMQHGDTNLFSPVCVSGYMEGDMIYLDFEPSGCHLTLQKNGDDYLFISNQMTAAY